MPRFKVTHRSRKNKRNTVKCRFDTVTGNCASNLISSDHNHGLSTYDKQDEWFSFFINKLKKPKKEVYKLLYALLVVCIALQMSCTLYMGDVNE